MSCYQGAQLNSDRPACNQRPVVVKEASWRCIDRLDESGETPRIVIAHWCDKREDLRDLKAPRLTEHYTIEVILRNTVVDCYRDGRRISRGTVGFGGTQITAPGEQVTCSFRRAAEAIHLYVPRSLVARTYAGIHQFQSMSEFQSASDRELFDPAFSADSIMGKLAWTLLEANGLHGPFSGLYCESLAMAVLARAMELKSDGSEVGGSGAGLLPWRLRRTFEYMEENLSEPITLNDIAEHAGLSRMHFAAQFKRATGLSPHSFLTVKRLEMANAMLLDEEIPIVQIALSVGFHSQAHFTSVFRKSTGTTPAQWRKQAAHAGSPVATGV